VLRSTRLPPHLPPDQAEPLHRGPPRELGDARERSDLARTLDNAVVLGDSHGDHVQAAKILDGALTRITDAPATERVEALAYRAELAHRAGDEPRVDTALAELQAIPLTAEERAQTADTLATLTDLT
jgi:hypothetical protein